MKIKVDMFKNIQFQAEYNNRENYKPQSFSGLK